ncbi:hypothetical protein GS682_24370 [Nostoc sp. B(2019)]|nr:hypothetical protein [Nostoc sp. B(2019)]
MSLVSQGVFSATRNFQDLLRSVKSKVNNPESIDWVEILTPAIGFGLFWTLKGASTHSPLLYHFPSLLLASSAD